MKKSAQEILRKHFDTTGEFDEGQLDRMKQAMEEYADQWRKPCKTAPIRDFDRMGHEPTQEEQDETTNS